MIFGKDALGRKVGGGRRSLPQGQKVVAGWQSPVWSEPGPWTLQRALNRGQSAGTDRPPPLLAARKKRKKHAPRAALICKLSQQRALGRRTRTTKGWPQKPFGCWGLSPAPTVLFALMTPLYWGGIKNAPTWRGCTADTFLNLRERQDSFKGALWALQSSRSERRAINPKGKLEVGNIIIKIWELLASKVRLFLAKSFRPRHSDSECVPLSSSGTFATYNLRKPLQETHRSCQLCVDHARNNVLEESTVSFSIIVIPGVCLVWKQHTSQEVTSFWQTQQLSLATSAFLIEMWRTHFWEIHVFLLPANNAIALQEILTTVQLQSPLSVPYIMCLGFFPLSTHSLLMGSFAWKPVS